MDSSFSLLITCVLWKLNIWLANYYKVRILAGNYMLPTLDFWFYFGYVHRLFNDIIWSMENICHLWFYGELTKIQIQWDLLWVNGVDCKSIKKRYRFSWASWCREMLSVFDSNRDYISWSTTRIRTLPFCLPSQPTKHISSF